jgi:hypothetical protein
MPFYMLHYISAEVVSRFGRLFFIRARRPAHSIPLQTWIADVLSA